MDSQLQHAFLAALETLPRDDRRLLAMYEIDQVSLETASGILGISAGQARVGLFQARRAMRQRLSDRFHAGF